MSHIKSIAVRILNKEFQVSCPPGAEEQLFEAAHFLDQKIREIRKNGRVIGIERMTIMAALNLSHELLAFRRDKEAYVQSVTQQIEYLQNKLDEALMEKTALEKPVRV